MKLAPSDSKASTNAIVTQQTHVTTMHSPGAKRIRIISAHFALRDIAIF